LAKIYAAARYLLLLLLGLLLLPGLLLPFLLELSYSDVGSAFSNPSACFAPLVGLAMLLFRWWLLVSL
jgi:hypothetical protein